jgi:hypothetical protein
MVDVCRLHQPKQDMPEGSVPTPLDQPSHRPHSRCELLHFLDAYSGYHQILLAEADHPATMFITPFGCFCYVKLLFRLKNARPPTNGV